VATRRDVVDEDKLDTIIGLLKQLVVFELAARRVPKDIIAKKVRVAKATVVAMLQGVPMNDR
jgi:hypothetical protein